MSKIEDLNGSCRVTDILNNVTNISIGAVVFASLFVANLNLTSIYSPHIYFAVLGYLILSQLVIGHNASGWMRTFAPKQKTIVHWSLQIAGSALAVTGSAIAIATALPNVTRTAHEITGIVAMVLTLLTFICDFVVHFLSRRQDSPPPAVELTHLVLVALTIVSAYISLILGLHKVYTGSSAVMYTILGGLAMIGSVFPVLAKLTKKFN